MIAQGTLKHRNKLYCYYQIWPKKRKELSMPTAPTLTLVNKISADGWTRWHIIIQKYKMAVSCPAVKIKLNQIQLSYVPHIHISTWDITNLKCGKTEQVKEPKHTKPNSEYTKWFPYTNQPNLEITNPRNNKKTKKNPRKIRAC